MYFDHRKVSNLSSPNVTKVFFLNDVQVVWDPVNALSGPLTPVKVVTAVRTDIK